jgi:hypothetical protein
LEKNARNNDVSVLSFVLKHRGGAVRTSNETLRCANLVIVPEIRSSKFAGEFRRPVETG